MNDDCHVWKNNTAIQLRRVNVWRWSPGERPDFSQCWNPKEVGFNIASDRIDDLWKENEGEQQGPGLGSVQQLGFSLVPDVVELTQIRHLVLIGI